jgi:hypothetical protein
MSDAELADQHAKFEQALAVLHYRIEHHATTGEACAACGVPESTFYHWLSEGVLREYLRDTRIVATHTTNQMINAAWPRILEHQIRIAAGQVTQRGANPTQAAKFLADIARLTRETGPKSITIQATFLPEQLRLDRPVEAIDGSARVLNERVVNPPS